MTTDKIDKISLPRVHAWDHFWNTDRSQQFHQLSWSKKRIIQIINAYGKKGNNALDAGCGSGFFSKYFCDQGMRTVSVDYSESALKVTRETTDGRSKIIKEDLRSDNIANMIDAKFDLIFSDGLFEHFSRNDQDKIMDNLLGLLAPTGVVITFVPNRWSPWELIRPFFMPGIEEEPFILSQLFDLNVRNGLRVLKQGGVNTFPFVFSPDKLIGHIFGMLLFTIAEKSSA